MVCRLVTTLVVCCVLLSVSASLNIEKRVDHGQESRFHISMSTSGEYNISIAKKKWLVGARATFHVDTQRYVQGINASINESSADSGFDTFGQWQSMRYKYYINGKTYVNSVITYPYLPIIIFYQTFVNYTNGTSIGNHESVTSSFPTFHMGLDQEEELGFLSLGGIMIGDTEKKMGIWGTNKTKINSGIAGGPLVLFNGAKDVLVLSSFNQFMSSSVYQDLTSGTVSWGPMGELSHIPGGTTFGTIMMYGNQGINQAIADWGAYMRLWYGKDESYRRSDLTVNYLGYWTDNGAYYYYNTEKGKNYEDTMIDVARYSNNVSIPYRYIQYDSWFYPKGPYGGVKTWDAEPDKFPNGLGSVYQTTGLPVAAHNRWWSINNTYARNNGGDYQFLMDLPPGDISVPIEQRFWDDLMKGARKWGLVLYEQDWLNVEFSAQLFLSALGLGRMWLMQMGNAARAHGITVQYCMANPRHFLQSLEIPVVTQARVSGDYHPGNDQWKIGISSIFADALGLAPFKDTFWSTGAQPGSPYASQESNPRRQAVVATLSTGPVGPSDKIGYADLDLIQMTSNKDGMILKPSQPLMAIDKQIQQAAFQNGIGPDGEVWSTYSQISDKFFGIVFASMSGNYSLQHKDVKFGKSHPEVYFPPSDPNQPLSPTNFTDRRPMKLTNCHDFCLYYTSPAFRWWSSEIFIYGEENKFVPMSPQRVEKIDTSRDIRVFLKGAEGENVSFLFIVRDKGEVTNVRVPCWFLGSGRGYVSFVDRKFHPT